MEGIVGLLCSCGVPLLIFVAICAGLMKVFEKAGQPGIMAFVPIYNGWLLVTEVCKMEPKWFIMCLIPIVNIYASWMISQELARKFGKSDTYGIGIFFLGFIFVPMLGFSDAQYRGGKSRSSYDDDEEEEPRPRKKKREEDDE